MFKKGEKFSSLECVANISTGKQISKNKLKGFEEINLFPAYNGGISNSGFFEKNNFEKNKIIVSQGGASAGFVNFITEKFWANAHCYVIEPKISEINNKYLFYFLKNSQNIIQQMKKGAGIPGLSKNSLNKINILIPPIKEQERIVKILDKFETLVDNLSEGLPKEIEASKKQYEYYRNKLLTFNKE